MTKTAITAAAKTYAAKTSCILHISQQPYDIHKLKKPVLQMRKLSYGKLM